MGVNTLGAIAVPSSPTCNRCATRTVQGIGTEAATERWGGHVGRSQVSTMTGMDMGSSSETNDSMQLTTTQ